jgi:hypothetical protein
LGFGGVTLDGRDPDPEGASRLSFGQATLDGVHDLLTEIFGVRFHHSMLPCSPSSSQHAEGFGLDIEGEDISDEELARYVVEDMRLLMVEEVRILNKEVIAEEHKRVEPSS